MKMRIPATAVFIAALALLLGSADPAVQQLLVAAEQQASIFQDQAAPLQLEADFVAQTNVPTRGHLTLKWEGKDRWWSKVVMGGFEQISIQDGDRLYTSRNAGFTPIRIRELTGLIHFAGGPEGLAAKKLKQRVENGISMNCLQVIHQNFKGEPHEVCVNATSHDILSEEWHEKPDELRREQFMDYSDFGGHRYPRELQLQINGSRAITVTITSLTTATFDEGLLTPPKGAIERRQCADLKHAVPVKTPDPMYPKSASQNKLMGDVAVAMTVLTDGSVTDIQLIGGAAHSMDDATLQTLKGWKFKPATCGTEPIVSDIEVIVSFRLD